MDEVDARAFAPLFREAYRRCFSADLTTPLAESESHHFSSDIFGKTGLVIGWKSLKNYSHYVLGTSQSRRANPSPATMDTLARYVAGAPVTDEVQRRKRERHYPYWFQYRERFGTSAQRKLETVQARRPKWMMIALVIAALVTLLALVSIAFPIRERGTNTTFAEEFYSVEEGYLFGRDWFLQSSNPEYWEQRDVETDHLTLFTLRGDNWPDSGNESKIQNLLLRKIPHECFVTELHLTEFFPTQNWQQAGILLLEDTSYTGKSLRVSVGYNDYSGGFEGEREIIIQAVTSLGRDFRRPEEVAHHRIFALDEEVESLIHANLAHSALRIEKQGDNYRLLYSNGPLKNAAFKEVARTTFGLRPRYIGLFAIKGFVDHSDNIPASFDAFSLSKRSCRDS